MTQRRPVPAPLTEPLPMSAPTDKSELVAAQLNEAKKILNAALLAIAAAVERIATIEADYLTDAPNDASIYGRGGADWVSVAAVDHLHDGVYSPVAHNHSGVYEPANANIQSHISNTNNPHSTTKTHVGLGNVENTALSTWAGSANITTLGTVVTCAGLTTSGSLAATVSVNTPRLRPTGTVVSLEDSAGNQKGYFDMANSLLAWTGQVSPGSVRSSAFYAGTAGATVGFFNYYADVTELAIDTTNHRVGIGLYSPSYKLDVDGDARVSGNFRTTGQIIFV